MMKKLISLLCAALLLCGCAFAEVPEESVPAAFDEPALRDPKTRYETYFEQTDGSEMSLFYLMDFMNDEMAIVEEHGALVVHMDFVDENGDVIDRVDNYLQLSDFGRMQVIKQGSGLMALKVFCVGGRLYSSVLGMTESQEDGSPEEFDQMWESMKFPFGTIDILHGVRQDEAGNTYALVRSDDVYTFEFAMSGEMEIGQIRSYAKNAEGVPVLESIVSYDTAEPVRIPQKLYDLMEAELPKAE